MPNMLRPIDEEIGNRTKQPALSAFSIDHLAVCGIALIFAIPFLSPIHRFPLPTFDSEWLAAVILMVTLSIVGMCSRVQIRLQWPLPSFLLALGAIGSLHWFLGGLDYSYSFTHLWIAVIALFSAYALGRWVLERGLLRLTTKAICVALVAGGVLSAFIQWLQVFAVSGLPEMLYLRVEHSVPVANVGQPNQLAAYLALGIVAALYLERTGWQSFLVRAVTTLLAAGVALTLSRMGLLMIVVLSLTAAWWAKGNSRRAYGSSIAIVGGYFIGWLAGPVIAHIFDGSDSAIVRFLTGGYGDRGVMWADALRIAFMHPLIGAGPGQYADVSIGLRSPAHTY